MPKSSRKNPPNYSGNRDREFTVVLEDLQGQFRVFGEGLQGVIVRLDRLEQGVDSLDGKMDRMDQRLYSLENKVDQKFYAMETKMDHFFEVLSDHESRITFLDKP